MPMSGGKRSSTRVNWPSAGITTGFTPTTAAVRPSEIHAKNRRVGWKDSTIRAMLHNESYVGKWALPRFSMAEGSGHQSPRCRR